MSIFRFTPLEFRCMVKSGNRHIKPTYLVFLEEYLNQPHTGLNDHKDALRNHMTCQNLNIYSFKLECKKRWSKVGTLLCICAMKFQVLRGHAIVECVFVVVLTNCVLDLPILHLIWLTNFGRWGNSYMINDMIMTLHIFKMDNKVISTIFFITSVPKQRKIIVHSIILRQRWIFMPKILWIVLRSTVFVDKKVPWTIFFVLDYLQWSKFEMTTFDLNFEGYLHHGPWCRPKAL